MTPECQLAVVREDGVAVATLAGELTLANVGEVGRQLEAGVPADGQVVLDLAALAFLDSAGIHLLFRLARLAGSRHGQLRLVVPPGAPVYRVIRIVDPGGTIPLHETPAHALAAAARGPGPGQE